ncbi:MAG: hypothetical protein HQK84_00375 [Nitrospinae bacterium]|nr:hypothetical protein [Nitrospinota bacterium]
MTIKNNEICTRCGKIFETYTKEEPQREKMESNLCFDCTFKEYNKAKNKRKLLYLSGFVIIVVLFSCLVILYR